MQPQRVNQTRTNSIVHERSRPASVESLRSTTPAHPILRLQETIGNQAVQRLLRSRVIQPKLAISQPRDIYEQEADRVADQVMRMPEPAIQRTCAACAIGGSTCPKCEEKEPLVQRHVSQDGVWNTDGSIIQRAQAAGELTAFEGSESKEAEPTPEEGSRCPSWFKDPQSLSKRAAETYAQNDMTPPSTATVERIDCEGPNWLGNWGCYVHFSDGLVLRVIVRAKDVVVGVPPISTWTPPAATPLCFYDYHCPEGLLVLTLRECKSAKPSGPTVIAQRLVRARTIQPKLAISQPGDIYEQEADRVAVEVMRMPDQAIQRTCSACASGASPCSECGTEEKALLQRKTEQPSDGVGSVPDDFIRNLGPGEPLDSDTRAFFEPRFGHDFSNVRVHRGAKAAESAQSVSALAYTVGRDVVLGRGQYARGTDAENRLLAHELAHVVQQRGCKRLGEATSTRADAPSDVEQDGSAVTDVALAERTLVSVTVIPPRLQLRGAPYIKKITVHLRPPQAADLEWEGTAPTDANGADHFTVSTGKGYGDPGDPPGTCTRDCCSDRMTQCAPPWNQPTRVGACCTYYGNDFWTGTPLEEHNGWKWWTPIQPYYSIRGIALHQHDEVTGQPIGHGCVRMEEPNAKRIYDYSNGRRTNVTVEGRAAPVSCEESRRCAKSRARTESETEPTESMLASRERQAIPGLEGVMT